MCEFIVVPDFVIDFQRAYGPFGDWFQLFRRSPSFLRLELHRDSHASRRFVTIDCWESGEFVDSLRAAHAAEFEALEARCQRYIEHQLMTGRFEIVRYHASRAIGPR